MALAATLQDIPREDRPLTQAEFVDFWTVLARERPRVCKSFVILDREEGRVRGVVSAREPEKTDGEA